MLKITIGAMLGAVIGFIICSLLNANKNVDNIDKEDLNKLAEEIRYLFYQVGGLKNRLESIENRTYLDFKKLDKTIEVNSSILESLLIKLRKGSIENKEVCIKRFNNIENFLNKKKKRNRRKRK